MDSLFNAEFDVNVLASAFNMDKADFLGRLFLIDNWTEFDNARFDVIRANSDGIEEVTSAELALLANVKAVILDENGFRFMITTINLERIMLLVVCTGIISITHGNCFQLTIANAIAFVTTAANTALPESITVHVDSKDESDAATVFTISPKYESAGLDPRNVNFVQTEALTEAGIAVQKFGGIIIPTSQASTDVKIVAEINGTQYTASTNLTGATTVDTTFTLNKS